MKKNYGAMGRRIDPSWWVSSAISFSSQCSTTGVINAVCYCYPVCGMVHIKEHLLLIGKLPRDRGAGLWSPGERAITFGGYGHGNSSAPPPPPNRK